MSKTLNKPLPPEDYTTLIELLGSSCFEDIVALYMAAKIGAIEDYDRLPAAHKLMVYELEVKILEIKFRDIAEPLISSGPELTK